MFWRLQATCLLASVAFLMATGYDPLKQGNCPYGFLSFTGGRCLHVSTKYLDKKMAFKWPDARQECLDMASTTNGWTVDLVFSLDAAVMTQITRFILNEQPRLARLVFHVGAERDTPSGQWEWLDGQPVDPLSYVWNIDMPKNDSDNNVKGKLVPSGAYNRFYMVGIPVDGFAPTYICEAAQKCD